MHLSPDEDYAATWGTRWFKTPAEQRRDRWHTLAAWLCLLGWLGLFFWSTVLAGCAGALAFCFRFGYVVGRQTGFRVCYELRERFEKGGAKSLLKEEFLELLAAQRAVRAPEP